MVRVAVVTGGTRGIGEAISLALKNVGYKVAANYAGNDERAKAFTDRTGIAAYKWDVSSFDDCVAGIKKVEAVLGPVDVIVNNAAITSTHRFEDLTEQHFRENFRPNLIFFTRKNFCILVALSQKRKLIFTKNFENAPFRPSLVRVSNVSFTIT